MYFERKIKYLELLISHGLKLIYLGNLSITTNMIFIDFKGLRNVIFIGSKVVGIIVHPHQKIGIYDLQY